MRLMRSMRTTAPGLHFWREVGVSEGHGSSCLCWSRMDRAQGQLRKHSLTLLSSECEKQGYSHPHSSFPKCKALLRIQKSN